MSEVAPWRQENRSSVANVFEQDRRACLDAGVDDFVPKPVEPDELYAAVLNWLEHRRPSNP